MADIYTIFKPARNKNSRYRKYTDLLSKRSPSLKYLFEITGALKHEVPIWTSIDDAVLYAVIGQMLSFSATSSIIKRLREKLGSSSKIIRWAVKTAGKPGAVNGVSQRKRRTLKEWGKYSNSSRKTLQKWHELSLEEYKREITSIWGLGPWSADMIAIFHLGRMDVWPRNDTGIQQACRIVFGTDNQDKIQKLIKGGETVSAIYLWELMNRKAEFKHCKFPPTPSLHHP